MGLREVLTHDLVLLHLKALHLSVGGTERNRSHGDGHTDCRVHSPRYVNLNLHFIADHDNPAGLDGGRDAGNVEGFVVPI